MITFDECHSDLSGKCIILRKERFLRYIICDFKLRYHYIRGIKLIELNDSKLESFITNTVGEIL